MRASFGERYRLVFLSWLTTVMTSFAFLPTLTQKSFVITAAFVAALLVLVGVGLRALRAPALVVLLVQLVALVEIMLVGFAEQLKFGLFPTAATFDYLNDKITRGIDVANHYQAPAPPSAGLTMMLVFYIGLIAVLVDFLAVTVNRVPLAGLPLLALYSVPVASLPNGVSFVLFLPGAIGYVAMIMVDERDRLAHWGRLVARDLTPDPEGRIDTAGLTATGRRISSVALATAVVVPVFIPVLSTTLFEGSGSGIGNGTGDTLSFSDPMVSLAASLKRKEAVDVLRVDGDVRPQYLRLATLDRPGPNAWSVTPINLSDTLPANSVLPGVPGLDGDVATTSHQMRIETTDAFPDDSAWLPIPYNVRSVGVGDDWAYVPSDQTITANARLAGSLVNSYEILYATVEPTQEELESAGPPPPDIVKRYTTVPPGVPEIVGDLARTITSGVNNHYLQAQMLQSWFRDSGNFTYTLNAGYGYGYQAMAKFLTERRGFCQHFAATMAMMARELGIPSRVAVGFLEPDRVDGDSWVLTSHNVHAWPELYFEGVGWVRFEPTPSIGAPFPAYAPRSDLTPETNTPSVNPSTEITDTTKGQLQTAGATTDGGASGGGGTGGALPSRWWLAGGLVVVLALLPAVSRLAIRRRRLTRPVEEGEAAESAWTELRDHIRDLRLPWTGSMTPRARQRAVEPMLEGDAGGVAALQRLSLTVERARYATSVPPGSTPAADAREVMAVISRAAEPGQRVKALLWPSSLLPDLRAGWASLRDRMRRHSPIDE
jgi:transglutaminase-like putative cysteine protease